jgi:phage terminase large subunit-like protein
LTTERELLEEQVKLSEALLARKLGRQVDNFYSDADDREAYAAHCEVFEAGAHFRERCVLGANRSGKSTLGSVEVSYHATGEYPSWWQGFRFERGVKVWACGESIAAARDIVQEKLLGDPSHFGQGTIPAESIIDVRRKQGIPDAIDIVRIRHVSGGISEIQFKSYASGREDFQGVRRDLVWMDEEPSAAIYSECLLRTASTSPKEKPGRMLITATPLKGLSEIVSSFLVDGRLSESNDRYACQISWAQTPHLSEQERKELIRGMSRHEVEARTLGHPSLGSGAIYEYSESSLVCEPLEHIPAFWQRFYALDVGWKKTAALFFARDPDSGQVFVVDEYGGSQLEPHEHAQSIKLRADTGNGSMWGAVDPASRGRSQVDGRRLMDEFQQHGLKLRPAKNEVEAGLYAVQCLIETKQLQIYSKCKGLLGELRLYQRDERGKPKKVNDHFADCLRYGVMTETVHMRVRPSNHRPKNKASGYSWTGGPQ